LRKRRFRLSFRAAGTADAQKKSRCPFGQRLFAPFFIAGNDRPAMGFGQKGLKTLTQSA
jgi:hypothetical protein